MQSVIIVVLELEDARRRKKVAIINPKSSIKSMNNQQLRAYFRETQDEAAFREILR